MRKIVKKVQQNYFEAVLDGRKRFEVRLADFKVKPGDALVLMEQEQGTRELTGRKIECEVLFTFNTKEEIERYGLAVLSIRKKNKFKS